MYNGISSSIVSVVICHGMACKVGMVSRCLLRDGLARYALWLCLIFYVIAHSAVIFVFCTPLIYYQEVQGYG